ncbi:hypothetical protein CAPTEDRAFT_209653 [Capitella teleta]|uniref:G-protein coupled receptors family 1 profile domain-containing protein n=1 Tax=Capitella teleta TaxID=283909 RepID=R7UZ61_CAPTE|nr:hypothetical protein CAPTEDRAFT_209653 [Capitella teleta]|eukprot:ELU11863.1 hypothetical protein CAPTEDRAFT_209653 [Capitella teleta]
MQLANTAGQKFVENKEPGTENVLMDADLGYGTRCLVMYFRVYPKGPYTIFEQYCRCMLLCIDRETGKEIPQDDDELKEEQKGLLDEFTGKMRDNVYRERVIFVITYSLVMVVGLLGNSMVLVTIGKFLGTKSVTNTFIASLACADLLVIMICLPFQINYVWRGGWAAGKYACYVVIYLYYASYIASCLTLTAMSIERWLAICFPMRAQYASSSGRARKTALLVWVISFALAVPAIFVVITERDSCLIRIRQTPLLRFFTVYVGAVIFFIPLIVMATAYTHTAITLWKSIKTNREMNATAKQANGKGDAGSERLKVIQMLISVLVIFAFCWTPNLVMDIAESFGYGILPGLSAKNQRYIDRAFACLTFANSCLNPLLYAFLSLQFRTGFLRCLAICCPKVLREKHSGASMSSGMTSRTGLNPEVKSISSKTAI